MNRFKRLLIIGAGGHGKVIKEIAELTKLFDKIEFLDDKNAVAIGKFSDYKKYINEYAYAFVALGESGLRKKWSEKLRECGYSLPQIIHESAIISDTAQIEEGVYIGAGAIINSNVIIKEGCILGIGSIVDHDSVIGSYSYINAGVIVAAGCIVASQRKINYGELYK